MDINHVVIIGNLTRDVELAYTNGGMAICNGSIAVNRSVKRGDTYEQEASFFDFSVYGKTAENLKSYMLKGKRIAIDGYLKQERWEKDGRNYSRVAIVANNVQLLTPRENSGYDSGNSYQDDSYTYGGYNA